MININICQMNNSVNIMIHDLQLKEKVIFKLEVYYFFLEKRFLFDKLLPISTISNTNGPVMRKENIYGLSNLHQLVNIILTNMIHRFYSLFIIRRLLKVPCT